MADEIENTEEQETTDKSLWELLNLEDPDEPDEYEEEQDDADEETYKQDKMVKKLSAKMEGMQKKFENTILRERINHFQDGADDLEKDLFKTIAADVKDVETFDKAVSLVHERANMLKAEAEKYREQLEKAAQEQVGQAWGTGPTGAPAPRPNVDEEELRDRIAKGDTTAGLAVLLHGDKMVDGIF